MEEQTKKTEVSFFVLFYEDPSKKWKGKAALTTPFPSQANQLLPSSFHSLHDILCCCKILGHHLLIMGTLGKHNS